LLFNNYKDYLRNDWIGSWIPTVHPTFSKRSLEEGVPNQSLGTIEKRISRNVSPEAHIIRYFAGIKRGFARGIAPTNRRVM